MIRNYLKIAFRNLFRTKTFSFVNIIGLMIGIASALLICLWINHEASYDRFHKNRHQLYRAMNRGVYDNAVQTWPSIPQPLTEALRNDYAGIENASLADNRWWVTAVGDKKASTKSMVVEPSFLSMFSFPLLKGDSKTALADAYSMVVTESMAIKMFGHTDVMGNMIRIDDHNLKITGIVADPPKNSQFDFEYLLSWHFYKMVGIKDENWKNNSVSAYVQTKPGVKESEINQQIKNIIKEHTDGKTTSEIFLHPLDKWRLYSSFENGQVVGGRIEIVRLFAIIAGFILLIACINFMNLSTARSEKRAKEVAIRKVAGAIRRSLIGQFLLESILLALISGLFSLLLVAVVLPTFNTIIGVELAIPFESWIFWVAFVLFILVTGLLAGSYPAFFLSSFHPIGALKGHFKRVGSRINPRKLLVVFQFCTAIVMIISTIVVTSQIQHARDRSTGFNGDLLVYHWITSGIAKNYPSLKHELLNTGLVSSVTRTTSQLTEEFSSTTAIGWKGKSAADDTEIQQTGQDEGLVRTAGLTLIAGRDLDLTNYPTDSSAALINRAAMEAMGFKEPIGEIIRSQDKDYHVVGVLENYVFGSPYEKFRPQVIFGAKDTWMNIMLMKMQPSDNLQAQLTSMGKLFTKYNPEYPFEYHFVDTDYALKFDDLQRIGTLTGLFAFLTIFISCLGLFGLVSYITETRIKEIGIRKVMGATSMTIMALLSKDFLRLILISFLIACPLAWYAMNKWLDGYAYRTSMSWWIFVVAGAFVIMVALGTIIYHAVKVVMSNPVKNLRTE